VTSAREVCPWNRRAVHGEAGFQPVHGQPDLDEMAALTPTSSASLQAHAHLASEIQWMVENVVTAMGNSGDPRYRPSLQLGRAMTTQPWPSAAGLSRLPADTQEDPLIAPILALLLSQPALEPNISKGFDHFYNLEYPQALAVFRKALSEAPNDPARHNHVAQAVLFQMMLRSGALESHLVTGSNPFLRTRDGTHSAERTSSAVHRVDEPHRQGPGRPSATSNLYARGAAYSLRGTYNFLVTRAWMDSLRDVTESRKLHNRVTDLDPSASTPGCRKASMIMSWAHFIGLTVPAFSRIPETRTPASAPWPRSPPAAT
jgi:hypothetical protein